MLHRLPQQLYRCEQVKTLEALAFSELKLSASVLMKRAGRAVFEQVVHCWPSPAMIVAVCGAGNNAGDGFVVAALAAQKAIPVKVVLLSDPKALKGPAKQAYEFAVQECVEFISLDAFLSQKLTSDIVVIDAILGSGANRALKGDFEKAVNRINSGESPVVGVDIPSGIEANTGRVLGVAVKCHSTVTFVGMKVGCLTSHAPAYTGEIRFDSLGLGPEVYSHKTAPSPVAKREDIDTQKTSKKLMPLMRQKDAHKGHFGHVLAIGGGVGMGGAIILAGESAARSGAGRVTVATAPQHVGALLARSPGIMAVPVTNGHDVAVCISPQTTVCIGPGLGRTPWAEQLVQRATLSEQPIVLDADALNILAQGRVIRQTKRENWILTPHPGEAARLLGISTAQVQADRLKIAQMLQEKFGGVVVLKGAGTIVMSSKEAVLANVGTPAMAVGGMGDVLSGIIASLIAQGLSLFDAAVLGVCVHGQAGELAAAEIGQIGLEATDLVSLLPKVLSI